MTLRRSKLRMLAATLAMLGVLAITGCRASSASTRLTVTGSTTILPIAEVTAEDFEASHAGVRVLVSGVGSSAGIESVSQGSSDIGTSSRDLSPEEKKGLGLVDTPIAYDAIAVIVNPANKVTGLTTEQVRGIFSGRITNWKQVGGVDLPIGIVNRDEASGTREAFTKIVLKTAVFDPQAAVLPGTGQVRSVVAGTPGAVGYISVGFVNTEVRAVAIDGVAASPETVMNGRYPIRRLLHFLTKGQPRGLAKEYVDYVLSASVQNRTVKDAGFLPIAGKVQ
jgi:phosphate transport system substrate-binding protein